MVAIGIDTAALGASLLDMKKDKNGIYHATFNCWQQIAGYNDFYDFVFDLGTSMEPKQFDFSCRGQRYVLWAWKGNYINLGAGAELGIYRGIGPLWYVDKGLAQNMSMMVRCRGKTIISYSDTTWWLTGFNPNPVYFNVRASEIKVRFTVVFWEKHLYEAFKERWGDEVYCSDESQYVCFYF